MLRSGVALALVYLLPGFAAAQLFEGRARWNPLLWVLLSLIFVPVAVSCAGTLGVPTQTTRAVALLLLALDTGVYALAHLARRRGIALRLPEPVAAAHGPRVRTLAALLVIMLTAIVATSRAGLVAGKWQRIEDDKARLAHTTSVATTGVPPRSDFIADAWLSYSYYDVILPGLAVRLAQPQLGVATATVCHIVIQTLAIGAAVAAVLFRLVPPWPALLGVFWLLFGAGWDFWAWRVMGVADWGEGWPYFALPGTFEIFTALMSFICVPQHLIAVAVVPLAALLIRGVEGSLWLRAAILGVLLAFTVGSSAFASVGLGAGIAVWLFLLPRATEGVVWSRRHTLAGLAVAAALSLCLVPVYADRTGALLMNFPSPNPADSQWNWSSDYLGRYLVAQLATAWRVPLHLVIDGGVTLVLFSCWLWRERRRVRREPLYGFLAAVGLAFLPLAYLLRSPGYNDFGMRGIFPSQFAWGIASAFLLASAEPGIWRRVAWGIAIGGTILALPTVVHFAFAEIAARQTPLPAHIAFLNHETALDEPVLIADPRTFLEDPSRYFIERLRLIDAFYVRRMNSIDLQYMHRPESLFLPEGPQPLRTRDDVCAAAARLQRPVPEVLVLAPSTTILQRVLGPPRYSDSDYIVFAVDCS